jgi:hypothetical protein
LIGVAGVALSCAAEPLRVEAPGEAEVPLVTPLPPGALPAPVPEGQAERGVVVLEAPLMRRAARDAVRQFFDAVRRESVPKLEAVLTEEAVLHAGPGTGSQQAAKVWASRFKRLDYDRGDARRVFREDELELYAPGELSRLDPPRRFVLAPREGELLAVANVHERRTPGEARRFGQRIEFLLQPRASGCRIREVFEDFRLP